MRFHPSTLSDALVVHDGDGSSLVARLDLLGRLGGHWRWLALEVVRVVQVAAPHLVRQVLRLRVSEVLGVLEFLGADLAVLVRLSGTQEIGVDCR